MYYWLSWTNWVVWACLCQVFNEITEPWNQEWHGIDRCRQHIWSKYKKLTTLDQWYKLDTVVNLKLHLKMLQNIYLIVCITCVLLYKWTCILSLFYRFFTVPCIFIMHSCANKDSIIIKATKCVVIFHSQNDLKGALCVGVSNIFLLNCLWIP